MPSLSTRAGEDHLVEEIPHTVESKRTEAFFERGFSSIVKLGRVFSAWRREDLFNAAVVRIVVKVAHGNDVSLWVNGQYRIKVLRSASAANKRLVSLPPPPRREGQ